MIALLAFVLSGAAFFRGVFGAHGRERRGAFIAVAVVAAVVGVVVVVGGSDSLVAAKILGRCALPLGLVWVASLLHLCFRLGTQDGRGARRAAAVVVTVTVIGSEPLGQGLMWIVERDFQADPFAQGDFDAVIVLGGGASQAPHEHFELGPGGDRILLGARLYHLKKKSLLVTTGTPIAGFKVPFDSTVATRRMWRDLGINDDDIIAVGDTRTTSEEATACATLIKARGWQRVGLVTSAWHLRRAKGLFDRAGVDVVPIAADHRGRPGYEGLYSLVPVGQGAWLQQKAVWELIGAAVGR
jgi:uncharacterized SAM-binding protein YcdF (DUF218 family)